MRLLAIADLHLGYLANRRALDGLPACPDDWLIVAGDTGETFDHLERALDALTTRFAKVIWTPGNHDLWVRPQAERAEDRLRGEARYAAMVAACRVRGVVTPEDPWPEWPGPGPQRIVAPLFLLYDYSFRPDHVPAAEAIEWAGEDGILCADERYLATDPHPSPVEWCARRTADAEARLSEVPPDTRLIIANHYPLRADLADLWRIPRFSIWCGTRRTDEWHVRFRADVVVYGHLHRRSTRYRDGVRFEEVSLGYPREWRPERPLEAYLREILPANDPPPVPVDGAPLT